jgi:hypothetical protein
MYVPNGAVLSLIKKIDVPNGTYTTEDNYCENLKSFNEIVSSIWDYLTGIPLQCYFTYFSG